MHIPSSLTTGGVTTGSPTKATYRTLEKSIHRYTSENSL